MIHATRFKYICRVILIVDIEHPDAVFVLREGGQSDDTFEGRCSVSICTIHCLSLLGD